MNCGHTSFSFKMHQMYSEGKDKIKVKIPNEDTLQIRIMDSCLRTKNIYIAKHRHLLFIDTNLSRCSILFVPSRVDLWAFSFALTLIIAKITSSELALNHI